METQTPQLEDESEREEVGTRELIETDARPADSQTRRYSFEIHGAGSDSVPSSQEDQNRDSKAYMNANSGNVPINIKESNAL